MILQETYTLANGIAIPKLGLGTRFIDNNKAAQAVRTAADLDYNNSESRVCREHADPARPSPLQLWRAGNDTTRCLWAIPSGGAVAHGLSTDL